MIRRDWESRNHARDDAILAEYEIPNGPTLRQLAKKHGICAQRIHQIVHKAMKRRSERMTKDGQNLAGGSDTSPAIGAKQRR